MVKEKDTTMTFRCSKKFRTAIKELAAANNVSVSELITEGVRYGARLYLKEHTASQQGDVIHSYSSDEKTDE
jgi:hypothetical protein